jgi:hypothetical protein
MSLTFNQGPLPNNFTPVDPSSFLEAWIAGTTVFGLGPGAFKGSQLQFVTSDSVAPDLNHRTPGMLWFKRGDGRLYIWDKYDLPSSDSNGSATVVDWLSISDRKDIWGRAVEAMPRGTPFYWAAGATNLTHFFSATGASMAWDPFFGRILWSLSAFGLASTAPTGAKTGMCSAMNFVALDTTASGTPVRFCELGFVPMWMASGVTGVGGPLFINFVASNTQFGRVMEYTMPTVNSLVGKWGFTGHAVESTATNAGGPYLRTVFKTAMTSWAPNGGILI